jgi:hypothetical protein
MMLIKGLRELGQWWPECIEAADEIEQLRADNQRLKDKLELIALHPDTCELIRQYAKGTLDH